MAQREAVDAEHPERVLPIGLDLPGPARRIRIEPVKLPDPVPVPDPEPAPEPATPPEPREPEPATPPDPAEPEPVEPAIAPEPEPQREREPTPA